MNSPPTTHNSPPTMKGWITIFYIRYGTKKLGPYYTRTWKQNGKLHRQYIKAEDLETVKAACQRHREQRQNLARLTKTYSKVAANLTFLFRMLKRSKSRKLRRDEANHLTILETNGLETARPPLRRTKRSIRRSIVLPGVVSRPKTRRVSKSQTKSGFMYPRFAKHSPNQIQPFILPRIPLSLSLHQQPMNPFYKPKSPSAGSEIPNSELQIPSSNPILEKLAALKTPPSNSASQKKLSEIKTPFPDPPKVVRFYFCRANEGDPMPSIEETEWETNLESPRVPDKTNTIYEYYRSVNPHHPRPDIEDDEEDIWKPPSGY